MIPVKIAFKVYKVVWHKGCFSVAQDPLNKPEEKIFLARQIQVKTEK